MFPGPVCAALTPRQVADVFGARVEGADCVEVRLDYLDDPEEALEARWDRLPLPVIATCRGAGFGGRFAGSFADELRLLKGAVSRGARYVDIDYRVAVPVGGVPVIASFHDFQGVPPNLEEVMAAICDSVGSVAKIAVTTRTWADVARVMSLVERPWPKPVIAIGMGAAGEVTRVVGPSRGSLLTYVSAGEASAPGQLSLEELFGVFRFRRIRGSTKLIGIVGDPVAHSASPELHNRAFDRAGLDFAYVRLPVTSLEDFFPHAAALGVVGFSVTIPHKVGVQRFLDRVTPEARAVGAVNTVSRADGAWVGDNTDVRGVREALRGLDLARMRVVVLGTGGAARAAVAALGEARSVTLLSSSAAPGVVEWSRQVRVDRLERYAEHEAELLINATPVGMFPNVDCVPVPGPIRAAVVFDMIYNPERTRLLEEAAAAGKRTISGRRMFLAQAGRQFEIWTGQPASAEVFGEAES